jgi:hypothetical protein
LQALTQAMDLTLKLGDAIVHNKSASWKCCLSTTCVLSYVLCYTAAVSTTDITRNDRCHMAHGMVSGHRIDGTSGRTCLSTGTHCENCAFGRGVVTYMVFLRIHLILVCIGDTRSGRRLLRTFHIQCPTLFYLARPVDAGDVLVMSCRCKHWAYVWYGGIASSSGAICIELWRCDLVYIGSREIP